MTELHFQFCHKFRGYFFKDALFGGYRNNNGNFNNIGKNANFWSSTENDNNNAWNLNVNSDNQKANMNNNNKNNAFSVRLVKE